MRALLAAALLLTTAAAPLGRECRAIRALSNGDGRNFADLNFEAQPRARLPLRVGRGRAVVANDETCDTDIDEESGDIACEWVFADYVAAAGFYDGLIDRLRLCLGQAVPEAEADAPPESEPAAAAERKLRANEAEFTLAGWQTELELSLTEEPQPASVRYRVKLSADTSRAEEDEAGGQVD